MRQIAPDLWQSAAEHPVPEAPDAISHAYLFVRDDGNVLFYSTGREAVGQVADEDDLEHIERLGGVARQYLGHWHEVSPSVAQIKQRFGAKLCCHIGEEEAVRNRAGVEVDIAFRKREVHSGNIEVIPTPGHTSGSACYFCNSPHGKKYLFTGDTIYLNGDKLENGLLPGESNPSDLKASLELLRDLEPDLVISAAAIGGSTFKEVSRAEWQEGIDGALRSLSE